MPRYLTANQLTLRPYDSDGTRYEVLSKDAERHAYFGLIFNDNGRTFIAGVSSERTASGNVEICPERTTLPAAIQDLLQAINPVNFN